MPANVILDSAARAVSGWDIITSMIKAWVFGVIISVVRYTLPPSRDSVGLPASGTAPLPNVTARELLNACGVKEVMLKAAAAFEQCLQV